ncbi:hypothetical protein GH714_006565 [Hevea brasiliensis]|uniref:non-specific serine/threonine protein kinase n=1 Tax=Hevea brasiliensis TaxID=3981 RepID=A0A6A6MC78_HEVBR|nr:hypothetical protein GH714_006565 [Hevea brasiliensis]
MIVSQLMGPKQQIFLLFLFLQVFAIAAKTDTGDFAVLSALMKDSWKNKPSSWTGDDPCGDKWEGIQCSNSRITDMVLSGQGLAGKLTGDIGNLIALEKLDLSLNKDLTGNLPPTIGNLKNLQYLLFDDNRLTGSIPSTITLVRTLEVIKLDRNSLSGVVNLSGLVSLTELDMSNNSFDASSIPQWFSSLQSLTTLIMENTILQGRIPVSLFSSAQLQTIYSRKLKLIDLQKNDITQFTEVYEYNGALNNARIAVHNKSSNIGIIIGASAVGFALLLLLLVALVYAFNQRRKVERASQLRDPFASWDNNGKSGSRPQITGLRCFSFEEIKKSTSNFSDTNIIGTGGYGKVYRGILTGGIQVAIKRAEQGSLQGKSGIRLSWERRLKIALDSARGLAYLHDHVNPPIIHRDVKSSNILLDDQLNGKVADFGLSKLLGPSSHVSDNVKGTMHLILDPTIAFSSTLKGLEKFVDLAMRCVEELRVNRPTMTEVVKEIENILQQACLHSDVEMVSNSNSQHVSSGSSFYSPIINKDQEYSSGSFPYSEIELK